MASSQADARQYVEKWLEENEEGAVGVVGRWLLDHPSRAKTLFQRINVQERGPGGSSCRSSLASLDVDREAQRVCKHLVPLPNKNKLQRKEAGKMDKNELFMELLHDVVSPNFDIDVLSHKILVSVMLLVNADRSSLFLTDEAQGLLVSRLFDVTVDSSMEDALHEDSDAIKIPFGKGIAGHVAEAKEPINIPDAYNVCFTVAPVKYSNKHYVLNSYTAEQQEKV